MWLKAITLKNVKSFESSGTIELSKGINVLAGPNSAGKSTIVRTIHLLQPPQGASQLGIFFKNSIRIDAIQSEVEYEFSDLDKKQFNPLGQLKIGALEPKIRFNGNLSGQITTHIAVSGTFQNYPNGSMFKQTEPNNFIYPYFSRRKPVDFQLQINSNNANAIDETFQNLPSKIDRLLNIDSQFRTMFRDVCENILEFKVSCIQYEAGKHAGLILQDGRLLPIDNMGDGILHVLGFLTHLCSASGKLFLIEEIENDLHPKALKRLLDFIIEKSKSNQFILTTHSNIVVRHLGSVPETNIFSVEMKLDEITKVPTSHCKAVSDKPEDRISLLESLGYEPSDFYLWKAYLILEESTAETIIRDFLIPFMVPKLQGKLKTIAAQGVADVEARFSDFLRLFVFIHTAPQYDKRAWVAVDAGTDGAKVISCLKSKFKDWPEPHFRCFSANNFENYYPLQYKDKAAQILAISNRAEKHEAKGQLAREVLDWSLANSEEAKLQFKDSAKELLEFLAEIQTLLGL
jgi:AAA15 family ATPase/GTPase